MVISTLIYFRKRILLPSRYRALVRPSLLSPRQRKGRKDYKECERRIHLFAKEVSLMVERGNKALPAMVQRKEIS